LRSSSTSTKRVRNRRCCRPIVERAYVRAFALTIACEIHPLDNLRVLRYLVRNLGASEEKKNEWYRHWVEQGLAALESRSWRATQRPARARGRRHDGRRRPRSADLQRASLRLSAGSRADADAIFEHCMELSPFIDAQPSRQPDAE
jgi:hypothetical protein